MAKTFIKKCMSIFKRFFSEQPSEILKIATLELHGHIL